MATECPIGSGSEHGCNPCQRVEGPGLSFGRTLKDASCGRLQVTVCVRQNDRKAAARGLDGGPNRRSQSFPSFSAKVLGIVKCDIRFCLSQLQQAPIMSKKHRADFLPGQGHAARDDEPAISLSPPPSPVWPPAPAPGMHVRAQNFAYQSGALSTDTYAYRATATASSEATSRRVGAYAVD